MKDSTVRLRAIHQYAQNIAMWSVKGREGNMRNHTKEVFVKIAVLNEFINKELSL